MLLLLQGWGESILEHISIDLHIFAISFFLAGLFFQKDFWRALGTA